MYERFLWYDIDTDFAFFAFKKEFDHFCAHLNAKKPNVTSRSQLFEKKYLRMKFEFQLILHGNV